MQIIRPMHTRKSQPLGNLGQMTIYRDEVFVFANELRGKGVFAVITQCPLT
ncbi:hypothetical protein VDT1_1239 [Vibrio sp. 16]|nr:hypothetical protein VDT1_1239 [Vibrio sp. 16]